MKSVGADASSAPSKARRARAGRYSVAHPTLTSWVLLRQQPEARRSIAVYSTQMRVQNIPFSSQGTEANDRCPQFRRSLSNIRRTALVALVLTLTSSTALSQNLSLGSREARPVPSWLQRSSVYELWLNAFSAEGNLRGAIPRLKQIADLGATIIYVGPIAKRSANPT